jgi:hypothetical protein
VTSLNPQVVRGPAPLSLALAKRGESDGKVTLAPWTETDFRDGEDSVAPHPLSCPSSLYRLREDLHYFSCILKLIFVLL